MNTAVITNTETVSPDSVIIDTPNSDKLGTQGGNHTERMMSLANEAVRRAEATGVTLDYTVESLPHVAAIAKKSWSNRKRAWHRSTAGRVRPDHVASMLGAYIGEMMVARHSATWIDDQLLTYGSEALDPRELVLNHMRRRTTVNLENVVRYFIGQEVGHDYV